MPLSHYEIVLHSLNEDEVMGGVKYHEKGSEDPPRWIFLDGYEQDQAIDLEGYWEIIQSEALTELQTDVTVRETIIKFGDTMQLVNNYRLTISCS